jgi:hypothetical protein
MFPMKKVLTVIGSCAVMALGATGCEEVPPAAYPEAPTYAPEASAQGQWVLTSQYGWVWVPAEAMPVEVQGEPYVYLYAPTYGWTWFDSPWGWYGPAGGWGWARPWYGTYWGPRYHVYAPRAVQVAPPAYRVAPRATNVAPPAYRVSPRAYENVAPPAHRIAPPAYQVPARPFVAPRPVVMPRPSITPHTAPAPHFIMHPSVGIHGGRR